jgi:signal transduction histidine kinase/CheY-like chemotaxis protein
VSAASRRRWPWHWPRASLGSYLVAIALIATVPLAALSSWQTFRGIQGQRAQLEGNLQRAAGSLSRSVERELGASIEVLTMLSHADALQRGEPAEFERTLRHSPMLRANWSGAFLLRPDGGLLFDVSGGAGIAAPRVAHDAASIARMLADRRPLVSDLLNEPGSARRFTLVEVPVLIDNQARYVLGAFIEASTWQQLIESSDTPQGGFATLTDRRQRVIASTRPAGRDVGSTGGSASAPAAPDLYLARDTAGAGRWGVTIGLPAAAIDMGFQNSVVATLVTAAVCMLLGVTLALLVARRVTEPLSDLAKRGATDDGEPIPVIELALLNQAMRLAAAQRKTASDRLQHKAEEFETLFHDSPLGLSFAQDADCRVVLQNAAMQELLPWPGDGGPDVRVFRDGVLLPLRKRPLYRAAVHGETIEAIELEVHHPGAPPRFVLARAVPLLDAAGNTRGAIGAVIDITDRKLAETLLVAADRKLHESQDLVDLAQAAGGVGFFRYQWASRQLSWSPGQARLFDLPMPSADDATAIWAQRVEADDRVRAECALLNMLNGGERTGTIEYRVKLPNDGSRWLSSRVLIDYDDDGKPLQMVGVTVDMSDAKEGERERTELIEREQAARLAAEASNRAKDEFLAMLGHELRNPLSAIASASEVLNRVDGATPLALSARNIIARQTRHLAHMMDDLLDVGRVLSGKVQLARRPVNLAVLVRQVLSTAEMTGELRPLDVVLNLDDVWVQVDSTRIDQVIGNLLGNAARYTPAGGRVEIDVHRVDDRALLSVRDTGPGIAPELLPRVFDLFVQGERPRDRPAGGLGVGLTLVKRLVELHDGTVEAKSSPQGSCFTVSLPARAAAPIDEAMAPRPELKRRRVAVVDDNADALSGLRSLLELDGHAVCTASDGKAGLDLLLNDRPDVAVVDIGLPGFSGYEVAQRARAGGYTGALVALTGYGQDRDLATSLAAGFDAHLVKPVDPEELRHVLAIAV